MHSGVRDVPAAALAVEAALADLAGAGTVEAVTARLIEAGCKGQPVHPTRCVLARWVWLRTGFPVMVAAGGRTARNRNSPAAAAARRFPPGVLVFGRRRWTADGSPVQPEFRRVPLPPLLCLWFDAFDGRRIPALVETPAEENRGRGWCEW